MPAASMPAPSTPIETTNTTHAHIRSISQEFYQNAGRAEPGAYFRRTRNR